MVWLDRPLTVMGAAPGGTPACGIAPVTVVRAGDPHSSFESA
jgi:hypothetical protein